MKHTTRLSAIACATALLFGAVGCSEDKADNNANGNGQASLAFHLTDAPAAYDAVYIDIAEIRVHVSNDGDTSKPSGWLTLTNTNPGIYNLLDFQNGVDTLIASDDVPAGKISQVRLVLGPNNSLVVDGNTYSLNVPSGQQSGLKLLVNQELSAGIEYNFTLDFDAARSIVKRGNGQYNLKPVIRVFTEATTGAIEGHIVPANNAAVVWAYNSTDTASAFADTLSGYFYLGGLPTGSYDLEVDANAPYMDTTLTGIAVSAGIVVDVDTLYLPQ